MKAFMGFTKFMVIFCLVVSAMNFALGITFGQPSGFIWGVVTLFCAAINMHSLNEMRLIQARAKNTRNQGKP